MTTNTIPVTFSGKDQPVHLRPFSTKPKADGSRNVYFTIGLPRQSNPSELYAATHGVSPISLPDGLNTEVAFAGIKVELKPGRTQSGNAKVTGSVDVEVDGKPMTAQITISDLGGGKFWMKPVVTNRSGGGFTSKTVDQVEANVFG